ncbi:hypothetical protein BEN74_00660 (plasmid) [Acinetobacter sp. WCHAc010034]|uniref:hypothetical protein n=1 Tax=Acinetobacter sp. WCHAc010034 TaxID=1879049 RepID=UPI00083A4E42|nr:hypothetical protein [Acinetobacter sp. WCHAc010034]AYA01531.1 hypothetical protein BEN74_00660 [Acinetobacter sp. WCHAc010034]
MKHLEFVGKSTEYIGYTHVEIINSSLRLSFNVPSTNDLKKTFKKMVENNYDLLMETSDKIEFELDSEVIKKIEKITKEQGVEFEEYVQNALIKLINQYELTADQP